MSNRSFYVTPHNVPYCTLKVAAAMRALTPAQRLYAHHIMVASWCGSAVVAQQISPESLPLLRLCYAVLRNRPLDEFKSHLTQHGCSSDDVTAFLEYVAYLYGNMGNYLSFGDSKFIPACTPEVFAKIVSLAAEGTGKTGHDDGEGQSNENKNGTIPMHDSDHSNRQVPESHAAAPVLSNALLQRVYDISESVRELNYPPKGVSAYYSDNITAEDVALANDYLAEKKMDPVNTRVWRIHNGNNTNSNNQDDDILVIRVASADVHDTPVERFRGRAIRLSYGDYHAEMSRVAHHLRSALPHSENATQQQMLQHYVAHFTNGDVQEHKASQEAWVRDRGPAVECNVGFIESYRDPSGVRAEWEGFVAVVNVAQSAQYAALVAAAEQLIPLLPWGRDFEKTVFHRPDFTSLDVLGFASSGIPAGINIPNYDDIRQHVGFKNVYLANVVSATNFNEKLTHLGESDWALYQSHIITALSVNVGVHELLGHGTGRLFVESSDGTKDFDPTQIIDPLTQQPIRSWYHAGETYNSVFGAMASSYEECRAEAVSLYLAIEPRVLEIFGVRNEVDGRDVLHVCWLNMVRAGLVGLEFYSPETQMWRQAHMRARFAILQSLLRHDSPIVHIVPDDADGLRIYLDVDRIADVGKAAIGELLCHLNVNKATADATRGGRYYDELTRVDDTFLGYREIVMAKRKPRKLFVQPHTRLTPDGSDVEIQEFEGSVEGMIDSFVQRCTDIAL